MVKYIRKKRWHTGISHCPIYTTQGFILREGKRRISPLAVEVSPL